MVEFDKILKKYNEIKLTKIKMDMSNRKWEILHLYISELEYVYTYVNRIQADSHNTLHEIINTTVESAAFILFI